MRPHQAPAARGSPRHAAHACPHAAGARRAA